MKKVNEKSKQRHKETYCESVWDLHVVLKHNLPRHCHSVVRRRRWKRRRGTSMSHHEANLCGGFKLILSWILAGLPNYEFTRWKGILFIINIRTRHQLNTNEHTIVTGSNNIFTLGQMVWASAKGIKGSKLKRRMACVAQTPSARARRLPAMAHGAVSVRQEIIHRQIAQKRQLPLCAEIYPR